MYLTLYIISVRYESFMIASKLDVDCQCYEHASGHSPLFAQGALFGSKQEK